MSAPTQRPLTGAKKDKSKKEWDSLISVIQREFNGLQGWLTNCRLFRRTVPGEMPRLLASSAEIFALVPAMTRVLDLLGLLPIQLLNTLLILSLRVYEGLNKFQARSSCFLL